MGYNLHPLSSHAVHILTFMEHPNQDDINIEEVLQVFGIMVARYAEALNQEGHQSKKGVNI